ncbi:MAG: hypothetical protein KDK61_08885, partial [Simkania sp.]|nr:hypothetical protein [Simkania sp.]
ISLVAGVKDDMLNRLKFQLKKKPMQIDDRKFADLKKSYGLYSPAINSGVIAFRTELIRKDSFDQLLALTDRFLAISKYPDQLLLNLFFYRKIHYLSHRFNAFFWLFDSSRFAFERAAILHFAGYEIKPWEKRNPYHSLWKTYQHVSEKIDFTKQPTIKKERTVSLFVFQLFYELMILERRVQFFFKEVDRQLGLVGLWLKKRHPKMYLFIKKIKK